MRQRGMNPVMLPATALAMALAGVAQGAEALPRSPAPMRGIAIEESLGGDDLLGPALVEARIGKPLFPLFLHLRVARAAIEPSAGQYSFGALDARLRAAIAANARVVLTLDGVPRTVAEAEPFRMFVASLGALGKGRVDAYVLGDAALDPEKPEAKEYAFLLKLAAVELRSADPDVKIFEGHGGGLDEAWLEALFQEDTAAYIDGIALSAPEPADEAGFHDRVGAVRAAIDRLDPTAELIVTGVRLGDEPKAAARRMLIRNLEHLAAGAPLTAFAGSARAVGAALKAAGAAADLFGDEVVTLNQASSALSFSSAGVDQTASTPHRLLYDVKTGTTVLAYWAGPGQTGTIDIAIGVSSPARPTLSDPVAGKRGNPKEFSRDARARLSRLTVPLLDRPVLIEFSSSSDEPSGALTVTEDALPSVDEIVARYQATEATRANALESYSASALTEIHFRPSAADAGYDVVTESNFYWDREGMEWEELSFRLNGARWGSNRPSFPLLQPEKVLSLPLRLQLDRDYRYRLEGIDEGSGQAAYVVSFDPAVDGQSLYRGRIWIDRKTFEGLKVQAVQTKLAPPVSSNEEIQIFEPVATPSGKTLWMLVRLTSRQIFLVAGRTVPVEKTIRFSEFAINAPEFQARREAARTSEHIMLRDTDKGLRYFVKRGGKRVVSEALTSNATALAFGTMIDPTFDYPLPIAGINYLNFDFLHKDIQLAILFGGVVAYGNAQKPRLLGSRLDLSVDFFGIALAGQDRVYSPSAEIAGERVRVRPFSTGLNLGWPVSDFMKLTGSYQFRLDRFAADDEADPQFVTPSSTATHGLYGGWELKRSGWTVTAGGSAARRATWQPWGDVSKFDPETRSYRKYGVAIGKDIPFKTFQKVHVDVGYYSGRRLDRFSKYQMGLFDETKVHGVPSSVVRFQDLALARGAYSFNVLDQFRFELFLDHAMGRDRERADRWVNLTGVGLGLGMKGPWNTLFRGEVGKSFLPASYRGSGSVVAQILFLKPL